MLILSFVAALHIEQQFNEPTPAQAGSGMAWAAHMFGIPLAKAAVKTGLSQVRGMVEPTPADTDELREQVQACGNCDFSMTRAVLASQLSAASAGEASAMLESMVDVWDVVRRTAELCAPDIVVQGVHEVADLVAERPSAATQAALEAKHEQSRIFIAEALCPAVYGGLLVEEDVDKLRLYVSILSDRSLPGCYELYQGEQGPGRLERFGDAVVDTARDAGRVVRRGGEIVGDGIVDLSGKAYDTGKVGVGLLTATGTAGVGALGDGIHRASGWVSGLWGRMRPSGSAVETADLDAIDEGSKGGALLEVRTEPRFVVLERNEDTPRTPFDASVGAVLDECCAGCTCVPLVLDNVDATLRLHAAGVYVDPTGPAIEWSQARRVGGQALVVYDDASYLYSFASAFKSLAAAVGAATATSAAGGAVATTGATGTAALGTATGTAAVGTAGAVSTGAAVTTTAATGTAVVATTTVAADTAVIAAAGTTAVVVAEGTTGTVAATTGTAVATTGAATTVATVAGVAASAAALIGGYMHLKARIEQHSDLFGDEGFCTYAAGLLTEEIDSPVPEEHMPTITE